MPRISETFVSRVEKFCDRMMAVADVLSKQRRPARLLDQIIGAGTSVGANLFEADQAMSRADFCKCLGTVTKEANECRFWVRLVGRQGWISVKRLEPLEAESIELQKIINAMIVRTGKAPRK